MVAIGQTLSEKYQLRRLIGDGGMGSVYEAEHIKLGSKVAIKILHPDLARRPGLIERFLREARVAAQIKSPHVVQVIDVDQTPEGIAYLVMELLEGEPLSSTLERERKLQVPLACEYARQVLEALEAAHALGVIHRDLKPENVFITFVAGKPVLKLIDFGIAKLRRTDLGANLTVAGVMMGTAEYMAPEQAFSADKVDARADLYAVGVMLYELISGVRPVTGEDARLIAMKVERGEVVPLVHSAPDVPREIAGLVHRAMAYNPDLRFASATEMRIALEGALAGKRTPTAPLPQASRALETPGGTGTVLGAPVEAALQGAMPPVTPSPVNALGPTARAPIAMGPSHGPARSAQPIHDDGAEPPPRRFPVWLAVLMLFFGAGGVAGYVVWQKQQGSGGGTTTTTTATVTATDTPTATATTTAMATATGTGKLSPLTPATVTTPQTAPRPTISTTTTTTATSTATSTPSGSATTEPTAPLPTVGPIVIPGLTNDAGLIAIPTTFPSGFPIPPFPTLPPPQPQPQ